MFFFLLQAASTLNIIVLQKWLSTINMCGIDWENYSWPGNRISIIDSNAFRMCTKWFQSVPIPDQVYLTSLTFGCLNQCSYWANKINKCPIKIYDNTIMKYVVLTIFNYKLHSELKKLWNFQRWVPMWHYDKIV